MKLRQLLMMIVVAACVFAAAGGWAAPKAPSLSLKVLVSNDDGIEAPGLAALVEALRRVGQVTVAGAREAAFLGIPAVSVNLSPKPPGRPRPGWIWSVP